MRGKQIIKYIDGRYCDGVNNFYLDDGWRVISITPVSDRDHYGAYVVLEKEKEEIEETLNNIGITTYNPDGTLRTTYEVL